MHLLPIDSLSSISKSWFLALIFFSSNPLVYLLYHYKVIELQNIKLFQILKWKTFHFLRYFNFITISLIVFFISTFLMPFSLVLQMLKLSSVIFHFWKLITSTNTSFFLNLRLFWHYQFYMFVFFCHQIMNFYLNPCEFLEHFEWHLIFYSQLFHTHALCSGLSSADLSSKLLHALHNQLLLKCLILLTMEFSFIYSLSYPEPTYMLSHINFIILISNPLLCTILLLHTHIFIAFTSHILVCKI